MKLGIIGAGMIVSAFLPEILQVEEIQVTGIYARRIEAARALCRQYSIPLATDSIDVLFSSGIDTVYVAVSNIAHYDFCKAALEQGLHVIVEKPITASADQAMELRSLAMEKKRFLFEAITTIHLGNYQKVQQWLPRIGTVRNVESIFTQRSSRLDAFFAGTIQPAFNPSLAGGCLMDLNVYCIHYVIGLFGKPLQAVYYPNILNNVDTSGRMILQYPGFTAHCCGAKDCGGNHGCIIQGTNGYIKTVLPPNQVGEAIMRLQDGTEEHFDDGEWKTRGAAEFRIFARAIRENNLDFCYETLEKSIAVSQVMTEARKNAGILFPCDE